MNDIDCRQQRADSSKSRLLRADCRLRSLKCSLKDTIIQRIIDYGHQTSEIPSIPIDCPLQTSPPRTESRPVRRIGAVHGRKRRRPSPAQRRGNIRLRYITGSRRGRPNLAIYSCGRVRDASSPGLFISCDSWELRRRRGAEKRNGKTVSSFHVPASPRPSENVMVCHWHYWTTAECWYRQKRQVKDAKTDYRGQSRFVNENRNRLHLRALSNF